jgi:hypothetical protein
VVNDGTPLAIEFPQTDAKDHQVMIPVTLKAGKNDIHFGRFANDLELHVYQIRSVNAE